jgi:uncharacterized protein DUF1553/uncharacterized protein DUF1549
MTSKELIRGWTAPFRSPGLPFSWSHYFLVSFIAVLILHGVAWSRPPHKRALADYLGPFLAKKLNDCQTCHLPDKPGVDPLVAGKPHNPFGARLKTAKSELKKLKKPTDIAYRLGFVAEEDADGDGVSNLIELLSGHYPGDPNDKPTPAEIVKARELLTEFQQYRKSYPWKPFDPVQRPAIPVVRNSDWIRNPIDAFVAVEHEARGLKPRPEASKTVLLRRLYLDLIGLPPTPEELHAFLNDSSPGAYEKVVNRLLASPLYGERWGRHWMDVWRYSDWDGWGNQVRDSQPHIWRWRDWIIESLNQDKGYDRMVMEMLAADELYPEDDQALRATGFLVRNFKLLSRERWLEETIEHTSQAFLGVTLGCARCHDHMFDPITQKEYYQVRAIFEPHNVRIDRVPGQLDTNVDGLPRVFDADPAAKTVLYLRGDERTPDKVPLPPGVPEVLGGKFPEVKPVSLPAFAYAPDKRAYVLEDLREERREENEKAQKRFEAAGPAEKEMAQLELSLARAKETALMMLLRVETLEDAGRKDTPEWESAAMMTFTRQQIVKVLQAQREALVLKQAPLPKEDSARAALEKKQSEAKKIAEQAMTDLLLDPSTGYQRRRVATYPKTSTGRRLAFARWIASRENPLAARVAMNHIWLRHFGQAIVPSVFDFGQNGRRPSHPALLDWLAADFMDQGWSMKAMNRLIVTSNTYRMASTTDPGDAAIDKDNTYLWHMPSRRMEAEVVRDCLFWAAGNLDLSEGGPDIDSKKGLTVPRRSIYFRHAAEKRMEFLTIFDGPGVTECYERRESVIPQQALALSNSELALQQARSLARSLSNSTKNDSQAFVTMAFERLLSRPPTEEESAECLAYLKHRAGQTAGPPSNDSAQRARESLVHVLMNHNDFLTIR